MTYRIPELGTFVGPTPARVDRLDDRAMQKVLKRWSTEPRGQAVDLSSFGRELNPWKEGRPIGIDSFAGFGGFSAGAELADIDVVWAVNHWLEAVAAYKKNHPGTDAKRENIAVPSWDWRKAPYHHIHMASPSCKGHTLALGARGYKGSNKKLYDALRGTARAVLEAAEVHLPDVIVVENVPEFRFWGAKQADGRLYRAWLATLEAMDYTVTENILNSADSGARLARTRLFIVARQAGPGIEVPADTQPWGDVESVIDWSSDRDWRSPRGVDGRWLPLSPRLRKRHKAPLETWVTDLINRGRRAGMGRGIIPYFGSTKKKPLPLSVDQPLQSPGTQATFGVYDLTGPVDRYRMIRPEELKDAFGFPSGYELPRKRDGQVHVTQSNIMLANCVSPPCAAHVMRTIRTQMALT